jgi:hypothetical protein
MAGIIEVATVDLALIESAALFIEIATPVPVAELVLTDITERPHITIELLGGGISEAPNDGQQYGRQSMVWTPIPDEVSGGRITIGPVAPATPEVNDVWIDTN